LWAASRSEPACNDPVRRKPDCFEKYKTIGIIKTNKAGNFRGIGAPRSAQSGKNHQWSRQEGCSGKFFFSSTEKYARARSKCCP